MAKATPENRRIYRVELSDTGGNRTEEVLVRANSRAAAERHVVSSIVKTELASQDDCMRLAAAGMKVHDADEAEASA